MNFDKPDITVGKCPTCFSENASINTINEAVTITYCKVCKNIGLIRTGKKTSWNFPEIISYKKYLKLQNAYISLKNKESKPPTLQEKGAKRNLVP